MEERLQKILSKSGYCSRRKAEEYLAEGVVTVNGRPANVGDKADSEKDDIRVKGKRLRAATQMVYYILNKPRGYVTTLSDEQGRKNVADLMVSCGVRVWPVGRLDMDSEGLLIMTNDGTLTHRLSHPSHMIEKEYQTWVKGDAEAAIPILTAPMVVDGEHFLPARVRILGREGELTRLSIIIREGKNRQIRRMCAHAGVEVRRLKRIREGGLRLEESLRPGQYRELTLQEINKLLR